MHKNFEDFKTDILAKASLQPSYIRKGQAVFNIVDEDYGVARTVQFIDHIDCFYDDEKIDEFLEASWNRINV